MSCFDACEVVAIAEDGVIWTQFCVLGLPLHVSLEIAGSAGYISYA